MNPNHERIFGQLYNAFVSGAFIAAILTVSAYILGMSAGFYLMSWFLSGIIVIVMVGASIIKNEIG